IWCASAIVRARSPNICSAKCWKSRPRSPSGLDEADPPNRASSTNRHQGATSRGRLAARDQTRRLPHHGLAGTSKTAPYDRGQREEAMKIETRTVYDVLVIDLSGRLDSNSSGDAGDRIMSIVQGQHKRVLLDLEKVDFVSSAGLRVIIRGAKFLQVNRGELKICNARNGVKNV